MPINNQGRSFWYGPDGESQIFEDGEDVPKGWKDHPFAKADHVAGGPVAAEGKEELDGLRALYKEVIGKRPFNGWSADELRKKMEG